MTCLLGVVSQDERGRRVVCLGGDSAVIRGSEPQEYISTLTFPKVFQLTSPGGLPFVVATSGDLRQLNLISTFCPPERPAHGSLERYLITTFLDALYAWFQAARYEQEGNLLLGCQGRLFEIDVAGGIQEPASGYAACGSGYAFALGALAALQMVEIAPLRRIEMALQAAALHDPCVRAPFALLSLPETEEVPEGSPRTH